MKNGRPPHQPDAVSRRLVEHHAAIGTPHQTIAKLLQLSLNTMKKYYGEELELGLARANAVVGGRLFEEARKGHVVAAIFWMKTRGGWRETAKLEHAGVPGEPIEIRPALAELTQAERDALRPILERRIAEFRETIGRTGSIGGEPGPLGHGRVEPGSTYRHAHQGPALRANWTPPKTRALSAGW